MANADGHLIDMHDLGDMLVAPLADPVSTGDATALKNGAALLGELTTLAQHSSSASRPAHAALAAPPARRAGRTRRRRRKHRPQHRSRLRSGFKPAAARRRRDPVAVSLDEMRDGRRAALVA